MRHIILHYHIFKNAGSTFAAALKRNFGERFANFDSPRYNQPLTPEELTAFVLANPRVIAISSHQFFPPAPQIDGVQFHEALILRNPLDRIRSMYDFFRRGPVGENPLTLEAKRLTLPQFLELLIANRRHLITNAQVNVIANRGGRIPSRADADRAILSLKHVSLVGVVDRFQLCALGAERSLRPFFPHCDFSYIPLNVTPGRARNLSARLQALAVECGPDLYRRIVDLNHFDSDLVQAAEQEGLRRLQSLPMSSAYVSDLKIRVFYRTTLSVFNKNYPRLWRLWARLSRMIFKAQESQA